MMSPKPARIMTSGESFKMSVSPKIVRGKLQGKLLFKVPTVGAVVSETKPSIEGAVDTSTSGIFTKRLMYFVMSLRTSVPTAKSKPFFSPITKRILPVVFSSGTRIGLPGKMNVLYLMPAAPRS